MARRAGGTVEVDLHTRLFELTEVIDPAPVPGRLRSATPDEAELATTWLDGFIEDADRQAGRAGRDGQASQAEVHLLAEVARRIGAGRVWWWVDVEGRPVHLTGFNHASFGAQRIGPVYTPAEFRGHGYASAAVAEVSRRILAAGARPCLFTDQANPTSNRIYQSVGFVPVVDMVNLYLR